MSVPRCPRSPSHSVLAVVVGLRQPGADRLERVRGRVDTGRRRFQPRARPPARAPRRRSVRARPRARRRTCPRSAAPGPTGVAMPTAPRRERRGRPRRRDLRRRRARRQRQLLSTTFEAFDTRTGTWTTLPPLPEPRDHFGLAALDGRIYLTGGSIFFTSAIRSGALGLRPEDRHVGRPRSDAGSALAARLGRARRAGSMWSAAWSGDGDSRSMWAYDPATNDVGDGPRPPADGARAPVGRGGRRSPHRDRRSEGVEPAGGRGIRPGHERLGDAAAACRRRAAAWRPA